MPYIALRHRGGRAALGLVDGQRTAKCLREALCGVCAQRPADRMAFLMRSADLARACSVEPALCPPCADYTLQACPMIGGFMARYRGSVNPAAAWRCGDKRCRCRQWAVPDTGAARLGAPADRWWALWTTQYRLTRDPDGRLAAGFSGLRMLSLEEVTPGAGPEAGH